MLSAPNVCGVPSYMHFSKQLTAKGQSIISLASPPLALPASSKQTIHALAAPCLGA